MTAEKFTMFRNRLVKVYRHLGKQARRSGTSCYRVYDHDLPEFPFCIEFYGSRLYMAEYKRRHGMTDEEHDIWMEQCLAIASEVLEIDISNIYLRLRQRKPGRLGQYQKMGTPGEKDHEFEVEENGLKFIVNLGDYLDTGLFLDHRVTRQMVREQSAGRNVLNLFAYTGSFSLYAAAGGASSVTTVDLSNTYIEWGRRNFRLNNFPIYDDDNKSENHFIQADVLQYLKSAPADHFDIIVLDPPTFSNSKRMEDFLDIQRDHVKLINDSLRCLKSGGMLYFSTNFSKFVLDHEKIKASSWKDITAATTPFDFAGRLYRYCFQFLKA